MNKKVAKQWVEALRSGKYKQGELFLCEDEKYCCLGVLNELHPELDLAGGLVSSLYNYKRIGLDSSHGLLSNSANCDFNSYSGIVNTSTFDLSLSMLNDSGYTFDEIADIIEIEYVIGL